MDVIDQLKTELGAKTMVALPPSQYAEEKGMADRFIIEIKGDLKPTQLRRFFHQIKELQHEFKKNKTFDHSRVALLMPILAYAVGRGLIPVKFYDLMKFCFGSERCKSHEDFENAAQFLEAILAYQKYHEKIDRSNPSSH